MQSMNVIKNRANNANEVKSKENLVQYYYEYCYSLVISTWIQSIETGNFCTWPGLVAKLVRKYFPKSIASTKGHMRQQDNNIRSTNIMKSVKVR